MRLDCNISLSCFFSSLPGPSPPGCDHERLQQEGPDSADQRLRHQRSGAAGIGRQHRLLALPGGGRHHAAQPERPYQDVAALWPLEGVLPGWWVTLVTLGPCESGEMEQEMVVHVNISPVCAMERKTAVMRWRNTDESVADYREFLMTHTQCVFRTVCPCARTHSLSLSFTHTFSVDRCLLMVPPVGDSWIFNSSSPQAKSLAAASPSPTSCPWASTWRQSPQSTSWVSLVLTAEQSLCCCSFLFITSTQRLNPLRDDPLGHSFPSGQPLLHVYRLRTQQYRPC